MAAQLRLAKRAGYQVVEMVKKDIPFSQVVTKEAMENMVTMAMAMGARIQLHCTYDGPQL